MIAKHVKTLSIVFSMIWLSSCAVVVAGGAAAGGYAYYKGELSRSFPNGVGKVYKASLKAADAYGITVTESRRDGFKGRVEGKLSDNTPVVIKLDGTGPGVTRVNIRIGVLGDRGKSERLMRAIEKRV